MKHLFFFVVISYYVVHSATCCKINRLHFESPFVICMYFCTHVYKHIFSKSGLLILLKFYMLLDHYGNITYLQFIHNLFMKTLIASRKDIFHKTCAQVPLSQVLGVCLLHINPFYVNVPFLYPLETSKKPQRFSVVLVGQGVK